MKDKLKKRQVTIGSWITLADTAIAEIMCGCGFDWLTVDMEHSVITLDKAQELIRVIELCGVAPLVRVGENNPNIIKRVMDAGAHGVIVPMVNSRIDAEKAVGAVKYPPEGTRGVGLARAQGYGLEFERYKKWVNKNSIVVVQIEHIEAVENLEEILSVNGVDGLIIGPYDLSGSLGVPGEFKHPKVIDAVKRVEEVAKKMRKSLGFHVIPPSEEKVVQYLKKDYNFIAFSLDTLFLGQACLQKVIAVKKQLRRR